MESQPKIYADPIQVAGRLDELSVQAMHLINAVLYGAHFVYECTQHDPRTSVGMLAWGKVNRGLRDGLVPLGWNTRSDRNYELTIHPTLGYGIAVSSGDSHTGTEGERQPSTGSDKGQATRDMVEQNGQLDFTTIDPNFPSADTVPQSTWLLLYHIDERREEIRIELSLPKGMTEDRITSWYERIILRSQPFGTPPATGVRDDRPDKDDGGAFINVPVTKKVQAG